MKTIINWLLALILISGVFSFFSCKKENEKESEEETLQDTGENGETPADTTLSWSASLDGTLFTGDTSTYVYSFDAGLGLHDFSIKNLSGNELQIKLADLTPGTYEVDFDSCLVAYHIGMTTWDGGFNPQGSLTITSNEVNRITGHFEATLFSFDTATEVVITSGQFNNLPYNN